MFAIEQEPDLIFHGCKLLEMASNLRILPVLNLMKIKAHMVLAIFCCPSLPFPNRQYSTSSTCLDSKYVPLLTSIKCSAVELV